MDSKILTVTFDSNVWEEIVLPEKLEKHALKDDLKIIKDAIRANFIAPYISDVILVLEAIKKTDRAKFLQSFRTSTKSVDHGFQGFTEDGFPVYGRTVSIGATLDHPGLSVPLTNAFKAAIEDGFRLIKVNRVAFPMADAALYKFTLNDPEIDLLEEFQKLNVGSAQAEAIGEELKKNDPTLSNVPALVAFAFDSTQPIPKLVAEWADGDALVAHYAHSHDYFCTLDEGKTAGPTSVLHIDRRDWLLKEFGINIISPSKLAQIIQQNQVTTSIP